MSKNCPYLLDKMEGERLEEEIPLLETMLLFDGNLVARFEKGRGFVRQEGTLQYERFWSLVKECDKEFSKTPMDKFRDYLEKKGD